MPMASSAAAAAPAAAEAAPAEEAASAAPAAEKAIMTIKLDSFEATAKAKIIREVKALLGCNLVEAKNLVEKAPTVLKENVPKDVSHFVRMVSNNLGREET
jgi:large subunit ribosomal protein L7/L12